MLEKHITRDGDNLLIAQMSDTHLRNFLNLLFDQIRQAKEIGQANTKASEFDRALYNLPEINETEAGQMVRQVLKQMYPYLTEAFLRDMEDVRADLVEVMGRNGKLVALPMLSAPSDSDF